MRLFLVLEVDALDAFGNAESDRERLTSEILRQLIEQFEVQIEFLVFLARYKCRIKFNRQHVKCAFQFVLHGDALAKRWREL